MNRTVYVIYGVNMDGCKDVLGLYIGENEGAKYWLFVLNELKNRGLQDIFLLCADGLKGLPESVEAAYPKTIFQTCIVHSVPRMAQTREVKGPLTNKTFKLVSLGQMLAA